MWTAVLAVTLALDPPVPIARCSVNGDPDARVYELQRSGDGAAAKWLIVMRSREAGPNPVVLPLPDANPNVTGRQLALEYRTLNGGRTVTWKIGEQGGGTLDVYSNFELEVNVEPDLDPRVELMNTEGPLSNLSCALPPKP